MACLHLARCRDEVGFANPASLKDGIHGGQSPHLGRSIGPEVVANGNIPGWRPSAEPLVQHDGRGTAIGEIDIEVAAMRHILLMQGNVALVRAMGQTEGGRETMPWISLMP